MRVTVLDGAGAPVTDAVVRVRLTESDFPYRSYEATIDGPSDQPLEFPAVFEGDFSVTASDNFARGGRATGAVPPQGLAVDVSLQLTTTGRVSGRFLWADRITPLPLGTVRLYTGGRLIGQQTTASEGEIGSFAFDYVPAGPVSLIAEDPRSGRTGVANGSLSGEGALLPLDVVAYAVGRVEGDVTLNDAPAPGAEVSLRSGQYSVRVTADGAGRYSVDGVPAGHVYASADLGGGFLAGRADGELAAEGETLSLLIELRGAGAIEGTLLAADGVNPGAISLVTLTGWGQRSTTTTDEQGRFRFDLVGEGAVTLVADALAGIDCDRTSLTMVGGETAPVTLRLRGVGAVEGTAQGSSGPVAGTLTVTGTSAGCEARQWLLTLGSSGQFHIPEIVGGPVSATFHTRAPGGPWLYANDSDTVTPGTTATLTLQVEPSGAVQGSVIHADGSPALGAEVRVEAAAGRVAVVQTGGDGTFLAEGVPAGAITIRVNDPAHGGVARVTGLGVSAGGTLQTGVIGLLETPLAVVSVTPPDGATGLPVSQAIQVMFNAPLAHAGGMAVRAGGQGVGFGVALSTDAHKVTVAPAGAWPDSVEVTVEAGPWVTDVYGRRLAAPQQTRFRTVDLSPPRVIAVTPADRSIQVDLATSVSVRFDEPLDTAGDLSPLVSLASGQGSVAGTVTAPTADTLLLTPEAPLVSNTTYTVTVNGARDLLGHVQTTAFTSSFMTPDGDAPVLRLLSPAASTFTKQKRPTIRIGVEDALSGPDASRASLKLDGFAVTPVRSVSQFSYVPVYDLVDGPHAVEASAHDRAGNPSALVASFHVDSQAPTGALLTSPGADQVVSGAITLAGTAMDTGSGVSHLSFLRDGLWIAEGSAANGFQAAWNSAATSDGPHQLTAQPVDIAGNSGLASPAVRVIVNNQPLAVSFSSPAPGFPVKDQVAVAASPSEPVARVELRAGSGPVVVDDAAPYEAVLDVSAEPEGELELTLIAVGLAPETATAARMVLVDRTSPAAPVNVQVESSGDSSVLVAGLAGSVELGALVEVENFARPARNERLAFADGSFALRLAGEPGDEVRVVAIDVAGNRGEALVLEVETADPAESVPQDGLALWARAGRGVVVDAAGRVSRWADASASANDLVQTSPGQRPSRVTDPLSGRSVLRFDGTDDLLQFTARLAGSIRTVFAVVRQDENAAPGSRALLGDAPTADFYGGWQAWWVYQPPYVGTSQYIVDGQTWVNGTVVNGRATPRPHTLSVVCVEATAGVTASRLAAGIYSGHWKGEIAELIVYERPLSIAERKAVEDYLALEYVAYQATAGAPSFTP
ncbi:MAG: Ig-like domain-containing protein, partial [Burkholderiales bacterium]